MKYMMYLKGNWLRTSASPYDSCRNSSNTTPANIATGILIPISSTTTIIHGNADSNSEKTAPVVPPISANKFFFQPSHIAENDRYILTRTDPSLYPNQTRAPVAFTFFASATSSSTSSDTAAWPPAA